MTVKDNIPTALSESIHHAEDEMALDEMLEPISLIPMIYDVGHVHKMAKMNELI